MTFYTLPVIRFLSELRECEQRPGLESPGPGDMPGTDDSEPSSGLRLLDVELGSCHKRKYGRGSSLRAKAVRTPGSLSRDGHRFFLLTAACLRSLHLSCLVGELGQAESFPQSFPRCVSVLKAFRCSPPWGGPCLATPVLGRQQALRNTDPNGETNVRRCQVFPETLRFSATPAER